MGLEFDGTLCVRKPVVLNVVCKPHHKVWGSLKHSPGQNILKKLRVTLSPRDVCFASVPLDLSLALYTAPCLDSICSHLCFPDSMGFTEMITRKEPTYNASS